MINFPRVGGLAALLAAVTYLVGFWVYFTVLGPADYGSSKLLPSDHVAFLIENQQLMHVWNLVIFIINAILLVLISVALHHHVKHGSEPLSQSAAAFGFIWAGLLLASGMLANISLEQIIRLSNHDMAAAATLWRSMSTVEEGLGGGNEITGGMWILLVSWAAQKAKSIPTAINVIGAFVGAAGVLTMIPVLAEAATVFGLGSILWFFSIGFVLISSKTSV